jgi:hypothetical protein
LLTSYTYSTTLRKSRCKIYVNEIRKVYWN